jgi:hypothetical protein
MPALGFSLFLIAVGAILTFALNVTASGIDIAAVGIILMVVGLIGMVMSMLFWTTWAPFGHRDGGDVAVTRSTTTRSTRL